MSDKEILYVSSGHAGMRLDCFLKEQYAEHSRAYFQYLIGEGGVLVNGALVKKRTPLQEGDEVEVCFLLTPEIPLLAENIPLNILYEDAHLLAINKPAGMVVHPGAANPCHTFVNALLYHCNSLPPMEGAEKRPGIVHRLDKETSGVLIAAKTAPCHRALIALFSERKVEKKYLAITHGCPKEQTILTRIGRHPVLRQQMAVCADRGKEAITHVRPLASNKELALVEATILTGRTHQIRVHLKHIGCPILGDPTYGSSSLNKKWNVMRQLLHAHTLFLHHPITGAPLKLIAELPEDFQKGLNKFRLA